MTIYLSFKKNAEESLKNGNSKGKGTGESGNFRKRIVTRMQEIGRKNLQMFLILCAQEVVQKR